MERGVLVSDLHGRLRLLENALTHAKFDPDKDKLFVLGDTCDIGNQTMQIHKKLDELGAIELVGNHEISHMCSINISPYDHGLDPDYKAFVALGVAIGKFKLAAEFQGVLMTHAGLSKRLCIRGVNSNGSEDSFLSTLHHSGLLTARSAADALNERLARLVHIDEELGLIDYDGDPLWLDWFYPLWFRPYEYKDQGPVEDCGFYDGFTQVAGHTPVGSFNAKQLRLIAGSNMNLIDPYSRKNFDQYGYCKYAIIEDGVVTVVSDIVRDEDINARSTLWR